DVQRVVGFRISNTATVGSVGAKVLACSNGDDVFCGPGDGDRLIYRVSVVSRSEDEDHALIPGGQKVDVAHQDVYDRRIVGVEIAEVRFARAPAIARNARARLVGIELHVVEVDVCKVSVVGEEL